MKNRNNFLEVNGMQIDRKALEGLLSLNDKQLLTIINRLVAQSGIDPAQYNIDPNSVSSIRNAIRGASDDDLNRIVQQYQENTRSRGSSK